MLKILSTVDTALGRFDPSQLTSQASMELLVEGFSEESQGFFKKDGEFISDLNLWPGIETHADGEVERISWRYFTVLQRPLSGTFVVRYLPEKLENLYLTNGNFTGSFEFEYLPSGLKNLSLDKCKFSGSIRLTNLPKDMRDFIVKGPDYGKKSEFMGTIDLSCLPRNLVILCIRQTLVEGSITLSSLPDTLSRLQLDHNSLAGTLSFESLPSSLSYINVSQNAFFGEISLVNVPPSLREVIVYGNDFWGVIDLSAVEQQLEVSYSSYSSNVGLKVIPNPWSIV